jgi:transcriptional regulator with XRE-family HTH domain
MSVGSTQAVKPTITYSALVGKVVEQRRIHRRVNQDAVANALGITQSAYSRLEQGQSALTVTHLKTIAAQFKTTSADILQEADQLALRLKHRGVDIIEDKQDLSKAGLLVALGILAALVAANS